jgi:hypothetical protein
MSLLRTMRPWLSLPATLLLLPAACAVDESEMLAEDQLPIAAEVPGQVEVAVRMYGNPDIAATSFASPKMIRPSNSWCSATMIGPNLLMSAAHCGPDGDVEVVETYDIEFRTFRNGDPADAATETFACRGLIGGWPLSDLQLSYCHPNLAGESPGDKYGYLGFDNRPVAVGEAMYSIWWQRVNEISIDTVFPLYSPGPVGSTTEKIWDKKLRDYTGPINKPIGLRLDLWSQGGTSGSSTVSADNHRIRVGPTSTAVNDGVGKWALSMRILLDQALLLDGMYPDVDGNQLDLVPVYPSGADYLGLDAADYVGSIDKNNNDVFDIQEDVERIFGENRRPWTHLGFDNDRRNALWVRDAAGTFNTTTGKLTISSSGQRQILRHDYLDLKPNTTYRVSLKTDVTATGNSLGIWIALENGSQHEDIRWLPTTVGDAGRVITATLRTGSSSADLAIGTTSSFQGAIAGLFLIEEGAVMDFDSFDERSLWLNGAGTGRGSIFPEGRTTLSTPNWAGRIKRPLALPISTADKWSLSHRQLALIAKRPVRVCFDVKERDAAGGGAINWGVARVTVAGTSISRKVFTPTSAWVTQCTDSFAPSTADAILTFGTTNVATLPAYLVDNLRVEVTSSPVATAYREGSFWGRSVELWTGTYRVHELGYAGNDQISSFTITPGYRVTGCINDPAPATDLANGTGECKRFEASAYVGNDFNDKISLIKVEQIQ